MAILPGAHGFTMNNPNLTDQSTNINIDQSHTYTQVNVNGTKSEGKGLQTLLEASIPEASHDSSARYPPPICHPGTRKDHVNRLTGWGLNADNHPDRIAWLKGPAGVGKSAIAQSCAEALGQKLGASFFFSRPNNRDDPDRFFPSISHQLATKFDSFGTIIDHKLIRDPTLVKKSLPHQFRDLLVAPFKELIAKGNLELTDRVIIVDGLDECANVEAQVEIVKIVAESVRNKTTPFLWIFSSRLEPDLVATFDLPDVKPLCLQTELIISREIDGEIALYLTDKLREIGQKHGLALPWPSEQDIWTIVDLSNGLFACAQTAVCFIGNEDSEECGPVDQLRAVLYLAKHLTARGPSHPLAGLNGLYTFIMKRVPPKKLQIVQWILLATRLPDVRGVFDNANLVGLSELQFRNACRSLHSVMKISNDNNVVFYHASFMDFLVDPTRSRDFCIWSDCAVALWDKIRCKLDRIRIRRQPTAEFGYAPALDYTFPPPYESPELDRYQYGNLVRAFFALLRAIHLNGDAQRLSTLMNFDFRKLCLYSDKPDPDVGMSIKSLSKIIPQQSNLIRLSRVKAVVPFVSISSFYIIGHGEKKVLLEKYGSNNSWIKPYSKRRIKKLMERSYKESCNNTPANAVLEAE